MQELVIALLGVIALGIVAIVGIVLGRGGSSGVISLSYRKLVSRIAVLEKRADKPCSGCAELREEFDSMMARLCILEEEGVNAQIHARLAQLQEDVEHLKRQHHRRFAFVIRRNTYLVADGDQAGFSWLYVLAGALIGFVLGALSGALWEASQVTTSDGSYTLGNFVDDPKFTVFWAGLGTLIGGALGFIPSRRTWRRG